MSNATYSEQLEDDFGVRVHYRQISSFTSFNVFNKLVKAKKLGDWISLYWLDTAGFITTIDKEKEG